MEGTISRDSLRHVNGNNAVLDTGQRRPLGWFVEGFVRSLAARAPGTRRTYRAGAIRFASFTESPAPNCLEQFYLEMTFDGLPDSTRAVYSAAATAFLRWLIADGQLPADWNLVAASERLKAVRTKKVYAVRHIGNEVSLLLNALALDDPKARQAPRKRLPKLRHYRDLAIVLMLYDTGARRAEIASLKRSYLDVGQRRARVMGKGQKERTVFFTPRTGHWLTEYLNRREDNVDAAFLSHPGDRQVKPDVIRQALRPFEKIAGVTCRPHTFRHDFARRKLKQGLEMSQIAALLGHASVATTASIYAPYDTDQLQQAYNESEHYE